MVAIDQVLHWNNISGTIITRKEDIKFFCKQWGIERGFFSDLCAIFPWSAHNVKVLCWSALLELLRGGWLLKENIITISGCEIGHYLIGDSVHPLQKWLFWTQAGLLVNRKPTITEFQAV